MSQLTYCFQRGPSPSARLYPSTAAAASDQIHHRPGSPLQFQFHFHTPKRRLGNYRSQDGWCGGCCLADL
ncbi:hypothetical protein RvY_11808 [Ramazzottius varieornatus]|uniref:Uncharacterized protein n=1 Tax=Ramazzottius varieornatus TaxID=947166 RepID=A0A1D1VLM3_RAMVA|nr:hypothetical protein RvY_11808 [Ramazzottius varieornatus]